MILLYQALSVVLAFLGAGTAATSDDPTDGLFMIVMAIWLAIFGQWMERTR